MTERSRVIVVGGAGGIGGDVSRRLAASNYRVVIADFNVDRAQDVLATLDGDGHEAIAIDVTDAGTIDAAFAGVEAAAPAQALIVASGGPVVHLGQGVNIATMAIADWEKTLSLNLTGVFACVQAFARLRIANPIDDARIVILGSAAGLMPGSGTDVAYGVSKAAIFALARQAAYELASAKITVNVVAPGPVITPEFLHNTTEQIRAGIASQSVLKRLATPDEVSASIAFLLSPEASYITGSTIDINGGIHMR